MNRKWSFAFGSGLVAIPAWIVLSSDPIQLHTPLEGGISVINPNNGRDVPIKAPKCENGHPARRDSAISYGNVAPVHGFVRDHFFPLCLGGPDSRDNILIQTKEESYRKDQLERYVCESVCAGKMTQTEGIELIRRWK